MGTQMEGAKPPKIHQKSTFDSRGSLWGPLGSLRSRKWSPREPGDPKIEVLGSKNGAQGCQNDPLRTPEQPQIGGRSALFFDELRGGIYRQSTMSSGVESAGRVEI